MWYVVIVILSLKEKRMNKIRNYILHSDTLAPIFWKLWFWWGIRQAMKERKRKEAEDAKREPMSNDDYWDMVHRRKQND